MLFGYMPSFYENDLIREIGFAKEHFDFVEITPDIANIKYYAQNLKAIKLRLKNFQVLGHVYWGINLAENDREEIGKAIRSVALLRKFGAKKITVHPSYGSKNNMDLIRRNNLISFAEIAAYCSKKGVELLVENMPSRPFNRAADFQFLLKELPDMGFTLDVGHARQISDLEFNRFLKLKDRIKHIHLHDNVGEFDHLPFRKIHSMEGIVRKMKKINNDFTTTLEMFYLYKNGRRIDMDADYRRKMLLEQLGSIKRIAQATK